MKVIKENPRVAFSLRLRKSVVGRLDFEAKKAGISRHQLIEAIVEKAVKENDLVVRIEK